MKGLLVKDFTLMKGNLRFYLVYFVLGALVGASSGTPEIAITLVTMFLTIGAVSTVSYDEHERGMSFLFTLPVTRKDYVIEKYIFVFIVGAIGNVISTLITAAIRFAQKTLDLPALLPTSLACFVLMILWASVYLPVQIKFGVDKSRIVVIALTAVAMAGVYGITEKIPDFGERVIAVLNTISFGSPSLLALEALLLLLLMLGCSIVCSIRILRKKEF